MKKHRSVVKTLGAKIVAPTYVLQWHALAQRFCTRANNLNLIVKYAIMASVFFFFFNTEGFIKSERHSLVTQAILIEPLLHICLNGVPPFGVPWHFIFYG